MCLIHIEYHCVPFVLFSKISSYYFYVTFYPLPQHAKKVVSDSVGLVDFAIGLVNSVFNLPNGQVMFFEELEYQKNCEINSAGQNVSGAS